MNAHDQKVERRTARLFRNGRSQAVRIPKEWEFAGQEVVIDRFEDGALTIHSAPKSGLLAVLEKLEPLSGEDTLPEIEDYPPEPVEFGRAQEK